MDIDLGAGINGTEAAKQILAVRNIPVVFLTSHSEREMVEKVRGITRYGYVIKNSGDFVLQSSIDMAFELFEACEIAEKKNEQLTEANQKLQESEAQVRKKLSAIIEADGDIGELELSNIMDTEVLQSLMEDFYRVTDIGVAILDLKGKILVATGWQDICTQFHRVHGETRKYCEESDIEFSRGIEPGTYKLYRCRNNMWDMATPLMVGGRHVGNLFLGQFLFDDEHLDLEAFRAQAQRYGFDEQKYLAALDRVPRWSRELVKMVMRFYTRLAGIFSSLSLSTIKLAREASAREKLLIESHRYLDRISIADPVFVKDRAHCWVLLNDAYCSFMGYPRSELLGKSDVDFFPADEAREFREKDELVFSSGKENINEEVFTDAKGVTHTIVTKKTLITDPLGKAFIVGIIRDLTERTEAEEKIKSLLAEKELLLREVHHRIKNNMNTMMNLLTLQSTMLRDPAAVTALQEARSRLQSMGLLYDKLYRSENVKEISLNEYVPPLIEEIAGTFPHREKVTIITHIDECVCGVKVASPLGLIINELITNAMKYAFSGRGEGVITVSVSLNNNHVTVVIEDNGVGIAESIDIGTSTGFGLQLVALLTKQLKGAVRLERGMGSRFILEFDV